ncbi:MAG TPA: hypothetical protein VH858_17305, partial [Hyphomicrobiales bacterium]
MAWHWLGIRALAGVSFAALVMFSSDLGAQELRGHGGPVRAIAVFADGKTIATGSFDESVIRWNAATGSALGV